jgi:hypothetical protein
MNSINNMTKTHNKLLSLYELPENKNFDRSQVLTSEVESVLYCLHLPCQPKVLMHFILFLQLFLRLFLILTIVERFVNILSIYTCPCLT